MRHSMEKIIPYCIFCNVGVDIAEQFHVARAVNFRYIVVGDPLTFDYLLSPEPFT